MLKLADNKWPRRSLAHHELNEFCKNPDFSTFRHRKKNAADGLDETVAFLYTSNKIGKADFARVSTEVRGRYRYNIQQIATLARKNDIAPLFVKQKYSLNESRFGGGNNALPNTSTGTYDEEVRLAGKRLEPRGWLWLEEASILLHCVLFESMEKVSGAGAIPLADGISAVDSTTSNLTFALRKRATAYWQESSQAAYWRYSRAKIANSVPGKT